ncbi:MAG: aminodeoxychorismate lyase [Gammaproteobacteria bacterium]
MIWVDGQMTESVLASDRGLNYADGLFETMRVVDGGIPLIDAHLQRLERDAARLGLPVPASAALKRELAVAADGTRAGVLKLVLTRGSGGRGYAPSAASPGRRIISLHPLPDYPSAWYAQGVCVRMCDTVLGSSVAIGGLKHLGRLEQVLASREASDGAAEGLMQDAEGRVIEGIRSNLFLLMDGELRTPDVSLSGVAGVMRALVIGIAPRLGLDVRIASVQIDDLKRAEALFLSNSVFGIWPVREVRGVRPPLVMAGSGPYMGDEAEPDGESKVGSVPVHPTIRRFMQAAAALGVPSWAG